MNLSVLLPLLHEITEYKTLLDRLNASEPTTESIQVLEAARPFLLAGASADLARPLLVIAGRADRGKELLLELQAWRGSGVEYFSEPDPLLYERVPWSADTISGRLAALSALSLSSGAAPVIVTTVRALLPFTMPPDLFRAATKTLRQGDTAALDPLLAHWVEIGYESTAVVEAPGTVSRRGGIVDIWPPAEREPVRIEFVGDQIETLRVFDPGTQRSRQVVDHLTVTPASEALAANSERAIAAIRALDLGKMHPVAASTFRQDQDALMNRRRLRGIEFYIPYFYPHPASLIRYLPSGAVIAIDDWQEIEQAAQQFEAQAEEVKRDLEGRGEIPPGLTRPYFTWDELRTQLFSYSRLLFDYQSPMDSPRFPFAPGPRYGGQIRKVVDELIKWRRERSRVVVVSRQSERLAELLREENIFVKPHEDLAQIPDAGHLALVRGALAEGWLLPLESGHAETRDVLPPEGANGSPSHNGEHTLHLLTDAEIFGWARPRQRRPGAPRQHRQFSPEAFFADLADGDYVVHVDHGIGVFRGLQKMDLGSGEREYLLIEYAHGDRLYVPVHQIDRLTRYVAQSGHEPTLHRLGTAEWSQVKERTQQAVADIARELLDLYAAREVIEGHRYSRDGEWQSEFEASFPYAETEDQLEAISQVKEDMEHARPMDRLVVGDVGYGKTEVALRAAFKAAVDHKQVAILVPTTVLAQQHYQTFRERLDPYPLTVDMLSRFRSDREQQQIVERIRDGSLDIVIGTHRLLSPDVDFKDLGLLIIDEEQRFGVQHKERLKQLRKQVDVLTLTATPIPRTLYLSLTGARDMSTIATPPEERQPIRTYVTAYDEGLIRDAILRELDRGGQVFFVHNRVRGIGIIAQQLQKLIPEARIAIGHGQLPEEQLETVMAEFAAGKYDVLVCTTIIESGIDIPNANTMIINNADRFGLAQLYQLRGRVGRSAARAYAYFLFDKHAQLSDEARERLQTIAESSELGAGFQLAMRDLEIRGAGDVLGARQSGHIAAVGFDLYCRLLQRAVEDQRAVLGTSARDKSMVAAGDGGEVLQSPNIELPLQAQIPEEYVGDASLRLRLYRRMADVVTRQQVEDIGREFQDRFGPPPEAVKNLLYLLRLKLAARAGNVAAISMDDGQVLVRFRSEDRERMNRLTGRYAGSVRVSPDRFWLAGPETDPYWERRLLEAVQFSAPPADPA